MTQQPLHQGPETAPETGICTQLQEQSSWRVGSSVSASSPHSSGAECSPFMGYITPSLLSRPGYYCVGHNDNACTTHFTSVPKNSSMSSYAGRENMGDGVFPQTHMSGPDSIATNGAPYDRSPYQPHFPSHDAMTSNPYAVWPQQSSGNEFANYSYHHGQDTAPVPAVLSSPRTVVVSQWSVEQQIPVSFPSPSSPSPKTADPCYKTSSAVPESDSNTNCNATIPDSDHSRSPCRGSPCMTDIAEPEYSGFPSPDVDIMDSFRATSPENDVKRESSADCTEDGMEGSASGVREASAGTSTTEDQGASCGVANGQKPGKSYAQLLYDCFMSHPEHSMTLQEIYQWFRENTSKAKDNAGKGWQNSVRHNLSMNHVGICPPMRRRPIAINNPLAVLQDSHEKNPRHLSKKIDRGGVEKKRCLLLVTHLRARSLAIPGYSQTGPLETVFKARRDTALRSRYQKRLGHSGDAWLPRGPYHADHQEICAAAPSDPIGTITMHKTTA